MRKQPPEKLENGRIRDGYLSTPKRYGMTGAFEVYAPPAGQLLRIIASDGADMPPAERWEHVSVSLERRIPNWLEMSYVKDLFWSEDECVLQFHPPREEYVNNHPNVLHLWKPPYPVILPPPILVGVKDAKVTSPAEALAQHQAAIRRFEQGSGR